MARPFCWICGGEFADPFPTAGDVTKIDCTTCGMYAITGSQLASAFPLPDSERFRFSFWNKRRQLEGREPVLISSYTIDGIVTQLPEPPAHEKPDILLVSLTLSNPIPGRLFVIDDWRERSLACARDQAETQFHLNCLEERGDLEITTNGYMIKPRGWERAAALSNRSLASKIAFVAMRFNDEMLALWEPAFAPAIKRAGFDPRLANEPAHNDQIDAHIIAELKQCRFVVADVTFAPTGVYFEAGYALGMGRPVIWTCREDRKGSDMHFDTRQYNHILWRTPADLSSQLYYRIVATI